MQCGAVQSGLSWILGRLAGRVGWHGINLRLGLPGRDGRRGGRGLHCTSLYSLRSGGEGLQCLVAQTRLQGGGGRGREGRQQGLAQDMWNTLAIPGEEIINNQ